MLAKKLLLILSFFLTGILVSGFNPDEKSSESLTLTETKADSILSIMTLDEKIGQMIQVDINALESPDHIIEYFLGSVLAGGDTEIDDISAKGWAEYFDLVQASALKTRLKIPILFGIDAVHGHGNVDGTTILPHNIGLGATRNPELVRKAYMVTAREMKATGINFNFAPCIAVARDERWGRTYESFGETPELAEQLGAAAIIGLQGEKKFSAPHSVLACAKHFLGDGGTTLGDDQGNTEVDEETLRKIHLPGYISTVDAGTGSIMVSYSSWNGKKMHGHKYLLTDVLKNEINFNGFLISDWAGIDQLTGNYKEQIETSINAGLDMIMIPNGPGRERNYIEFISLLKELVNEGKVSRARIDDAVKRILKVKIDMNLFENPFRDKSLLTTIGSEENREIARQCVRESLVLLKNERYALPLPKDLKNILIAGTGGNDIGMQCGGWTLKWNGAVGLDFSGGTTIYEAIKKKLPDTEVIYSEDGDGAYEADAVIAVIGEEPYAEGNGDREDLSLSEEDQELIEKLKKSGKPLIVILLSGRPMIIEPSLNLADAFIAAWLPGTEGDGIADVLFGDFKPTGKLPHSWPRKMEQIPINFGDKNYDPLFPYGFGLSY